MHTRLIGRFQSGPEAQDVPKTTNLSMQVTQFHWVETALFISQFENYPQWTQSIWEHKLNPTSSIP